MTVAEFLDWEARQELRYEFDGERPVAMNGGTLEHGLIVSNLKFLLHGQLRGKPCREHGSNVKIEVLGRIRYPDVVVNCTPAARGATIVPEPVVVFELLSPGTAAIDRIEKLREYQAMASIRRYVMLDQDAVGATIYVRGPDGWTVDVLTLGTIDLPEIGASVSLDGIYEGVALPTP